MRSAPIALALLTVLTAAACSDDPAAGPRPGPTGPCAAERSQPPDGSQEQRLQGDLDGDGRTDEVVSWVRGGERVAQAWLATGENAVPEALFSGDLLATADLDGDRRDEVLAATGDEATGFLLDGCRLVPITVGETDTAWTFAPGPEAPLLCRPGALVQETRERGPDTLRRTWRISAGTATEVDPAGSQPGITCG
ncbi:MAG: hypothetical protein EPN99_14370 [Frankiales bacterium]|nr:MAG: hypothetical protein EPN99_14370 [Frankiales bacterium]